MPTSETGYPRREQYWTGQHEDRHQFACFCDAISTTYAGIQPACDNPTRFDARYTSIQFNTTTLAHIEAPSHQARRDAQLLSQRPDDSFFLNFCDERAYLVEQGSLNVRVSPGRPVLLDNARVFRVQFEGSPRMNLHSLRLPRSVLGDLSPSLVERLNLAFGNHPGGRLLGRQMSLLCDAGRLEQWSVASQMSDTLVSLLTVLAREIKQPGSGSPRASEEGATLERIKRLARGRLADPEVGIEQIAYQLGCTTRTLQKRFAEYDQTFSAWLMEERLTALRTLLDEPANALKSTEWLAFACGFRDASHFRRRFKARFGVSPGQYRRARFGNAERG